MALYLGNKRMNDMYYTIGQVAKIHHLTISQIRYYDKQGLFPFLKRNEKGDRVFDEEALKYLEMILCLKIPVCRSKNKTIYRLVYGGRIYYPSTVGTNATTGNECLTTHSRNRRKLKKIQKNCKI